MIHLSTRGPFEGFTSAVLLGSGPSLDDWDGDAQPGELVLGLNEAGLVGLARDDMTILMARDPDPVQVWIHDLAGDAPLVPQVVVLEDRWAELPQAWRTEGFYWTRSDMLAAQAHPGTGTVALEMLGQAGIQRVALWGLDTLQASLRGADAGPGTSRCIQAIWDRVGYRPAAKIPKDYARIASAMRRVASRHGIRLVDGRD